MKNVEQVKSSKSVVRRGRPTGYRMNSGSKKAISVSRTGYRHSEATKRLISEGVKKHHLVGAPLDVLLITDLSKCGTFISKKGYTEVCIPNPIVGEPTYRERLHCALVEQLLGRKLRNGEEVHHLQDKSCNDIHTLYLCKNRQEHVFLDKIKKRMDALLAGGTKLEENNE